MRDLVLGGSGGSGGRVVPGHAFKGVLVARKPEGRASGRVRDGHF